MKMPPLFSALAIGLLVSTLNEPAAHGADKFALQDQQDIDDVVVQFVGKPVKLMLKSGQELSGTLTKCSARTGHVILLHLSALTGSEFYDAVVLSDEVAAIVIRTK